MENKTLITEICKTYGLTQATLADHLGVPVQVVHNWYTGKNDPPRGTSKRLAELLLDIKKEEKEQGTVENHHILGR